MRRLPPLSLRTRVSLVITGLAAGMLLILAGLWLQGARSGIHEEVEAASRVSEQWLRALAGEMQDVPAAELPARVLAVVRPLGRVRANGLEVFAADGGLLYRSPPPTYKAGRTVPAAFAALVRPQFEPRRVVIGSLVLVLTPDPSRSVIDTWDDLGAMAVLAAALLGLLFLAVHRALDRALRPLGLVMAALDRTGSGCFDTRLPVFPVPELGRLSRAFNGMADRLAEAVDENVRMESEQEVARRLQARLEEERRGIARELHDELAQGITAVRALAGAIVQRTGEQPALHGHAQSIVAVTGEMQDGVRAILQRLRPAAGDGLGPALERCVAAWQGQHPDIALAARIDLGTGPVAAEIAQTVLRIVQEGLTNIVRHAGASTARLTVGRDDGWLTVALADNGRGLGGCPSTQPGCGLGLTGMGERIALHGGRLAFTNAPGGGLQLVACLPEDHHSPLQAEETA